MTATETQTPTNQGSNISFWVTPVGTAGPQSIATVDGRGVHPSSANVYDLGSNSNRWANVWIGPASLHLQDQTTFADVDLTFNNGTLYLNGAQNVALGNLVISNVSLLTSNPAFPINLGQDSDTGNIIAYRQFDVLQPLTGNVTFSVQRSGRVQINAPSIPAGDVGAFAIIGNPNNAYQPVTNSGSMINVTGNDGAASRITNDAYGSFAAFVGRSALGTAEAPTALQSGNTILRISAVGYQGSSAGFGTVGQTAATGIDFVSLDNVTPATSGSQIQFFSAPVGTNTRVQAASIDSTVGLKLPVAGTGITFQDGSFQNVAAIPAILYGNINGVATLDSTGVVPLSQIPPSIKGGVQYIGSWDSANNSPYLQNGTGSQGYEYSIATTGYANLGVATGNIQYLAGGFVIYNGTVWNYIPPSSTFTSLTGGGHITISSPTGAMTLGSDATSSAVASTLVARDINGGFAANVITATAFAGPATSAATAGTVTNPAQPAITSVGTLSSLSVAGNVAVGNLSAAGLISAANLTGTVTTSAQPLITSLGTLTSLGVVGNVTASYFVGTGANLSGGAAVTTLTAGNITTGNIAVTNLATVRLLTATGNITAGNISTAGVANVGTLAVVGNETVGGNVTVTGNITAGVDVTANVVIANTRVVSSGGWRIAAAGTAADTINFTTDSIVMYPSIPGTGLTLSLAGLRAGSSVTVLVTASVFGAKVTHGLPAGLSTIGAVQTASLKNPGAAQLVYTCVDGTSANTIVAVSYQ